MPTVNVHPTLISWALSQNRERNLDERLMKNIEEWLSGSRKPTFSQIEDFSKKTNIPLGYFFLQEPPKENIKLLEYRTINSTQMDNPSRNLVDTIYQMEAVQDWMREYRQESGFDELAFVGSMKSSTDKNAIANKIREDLGLEETWFEKGRDAREAFTHIRKQLENCGVIVMMNGIVANNTHRPLDINEFRAFAITDKWAPLIFINAADSNSAKLFSLFHEIAHIWIGRNDLFNNRNNQPEGVSATEVLCNAVAGELLVPEKIFAREWRLRETNTNKRIVIGDLAKYFRCGEIVVARKALDSFKITSDLYREVVRTAIENYNRRKEKEEKSGGDYYRTMRSRMDGSFVRALCESIKTGRTTFTEAYRLTGTTDKTFSKVTEGFGGV